MRDSARSPWRDTPDLARIVPSALHCARFVALPFPACPLPFEVFCNEPPPTADDMRRRAGRGPAAVSGRVEGRSGFESRGGRFAACYTAGPFNRRPAGGRPPLTRLGLAPEFTEAVRHGHGCRVAATPPQRGTTTPK